jgi:DNA-binding response OmpR family regulator
MIDRLPPILIIDRDSNWGTELRDRLVKDKIEAYVVNSLPAAIALCRSKPIGIAIISYADDAHTRSVCEEMRKLDIQTIYRQDPCDAELASRGVRWLRP